jgi:hypothetical protein
MNLLLLSGNSVRNKPWIHDVDDRLSRHFDKTLVHHYAHWDSGAEFINFDDELSSVADEATDFQPYAIFAKSVGSVLTIRGIAEGKLKPKAVVVTGLPLKVIQENNLPVIEWLIKVDIPMLIIQNENDPLGSYEEVSAYTKNSANSYVSTMVLPGDSHEYTDFAKLDELSSVLYA